jgi:hypothetical protein
LLILIDYSTGRSSEQLFIHSDSATDQKSAIVVIDEKAGQLIFQCKDQKLPDVLPNWVKSITPDQLGVGCF